MTGALHELLAGLDVESVGEDVYAFARDAYPICRSITGDGVRATLDLVERHFLERNVGADVDFERHEVPTGTPVFDWTVPREWSIREAWVKDASGRTVVDFARHNLQVLNYSVPFRGRVDRAELDAHLYSLPEQPDRIPYRTSYYQERWGFCLPHRVRESLPEGEYEVLVDSSLEDGHLTYGEVVLPGERDEIVLVSAHVCHPSLANDNLSGVGVAAALARELAALPRRFTYRFVFIPGTIGSITWLARNEEAARRVRHGLVLANLGDPGPFHYKRSRRGDATVDRAVARVLADSKGDHTLEDFVPFGYDERQYCSPGFDLPVGLFSRTPWGRYPEYHTSGDDLDFIRPSCLGESLGRLLEVVRVLEGDGVYRNLAPHCEPQLGRRGLYRTLGGSESGRERELALLWMLNQSDGTRSLLDVAERSGTSFGRLLEATDALVEAELLERVGDG